MKDSVKFLFFILIGSACLMLEAFYNGFPIVYSDTSTYLASGFDLETPFDRPITYGLFIRLFSLNGLSLWLVIFFQALIVSFLIFSVTKIILGEKMFLKAGLAIIFFLSAFTGLSWTVCQLISDIFTPIALLSLILILFEKTNKSLFYVLFVLSVAMHLSHILLFVLIIICVLVFKKYLLPSEYYPTRNKRIAALLLMSVIPIIIMGSAMSKSKHVFFMGAMIEHGILKQYLDDNCSAKNYKLCAYKDSLPDRAYQFIWDKGSPFYKIGGWKETKTEFSEIISATLTQPRYIKMHLVESVKATYQQLIRFDVGEGNGSFLEGTLLHERISTYFPDDLASYSTSKQSESELNYLNFKNNLFTAVVIISLLSLIVLLLIKNTTFSSNFKGMVVLLFIGILLNAWDCGTFANAIERLGCKMIWLIPFITALALLKLLAQRFISPLINKQ